jgi:hypothetical protein
MRWRGEFAGSGTRNHAPRGQLADNEANQTYRSSTMALAFHAPAYETAPTYEDESTLPPEVETHVRTYRKFVRCITIGFCGVPFLMAFVLYWLN